MADQHPGSLKSAHGPFSVYRLSPAVKDFLAGAAGGVAGIIAGQPLDVVRVRLQQKSSCTKSLASMWQLIVRQEGMRSLFKGAGYPITTIAMQNAVVFYSYGVGCRWLASRDSKNTTSKEPLKLWQVYAAGTFAGLMQTAITTPTELLKIRLQLQTQLPGSPGYVGPIRLLKQVAMREGIIGLWRGTAVTLLRDWPSFGVYFAVYEGMQEVLQPGSRASKEISPLALLTAGGLAGSIAWWSVYPLDVIKSRIQASSKADSEYKGWIDCAKVSWKEEGRGVFFNGMTATVTRAFIVNAAVFSVYEFLLKLMDTEE
ncbi:hypothetical protein WJX77_007513 [Trebouxia sp. C0004]